MTQEESDMEVVAVVHERACPDCGAGIGEMHESGCCVERCSVCGGQRRSCIGRETTPDPPGLCEDHDPESVVWTGEHPGVAECRSRGLWCVRNPDGPGYVPCGPEAPGAVPDLNRLWHADWKFEARARDFAR